MTLMPNLFGEWTVMREWGRIGSPGRLRADIHPDPGAACRLWVPCSIGSAVAAICKDSFIHIGVDRSVYDTGMIVR